MCLYYLQNKANSGEVVVVLGLFGNKTDHPLAEMKSAQALLDDIPKGDSIRALQEISDWLEALRGQADDFRVDHQWAVLRLYDQAAQARITCSKAVSVRSS